VHVSCGKYHTAALSASGDVFCWGLESSGQLGLGSRRLKAPTPQKVDTLSGIGVTALSCGMYHTLALTADGEVYSCGYGGSFMSGAGALGHGDRTQLEEPTKLAFFGDGGSGGVRAATISAGGYHSVVRDVDGGVWSWGRGEWGRLGHYDSSDCLEPTRVEECDELGGIQAAFAADAHSACLAADGAVYTWGRNEHWQLGYEVVGLLNSGESFNAQQEPAVVEMPEEAGVAKAVHMAVGEQGCAVLLDDSSIWLWGMGRYFVPTRLPLDGATIDGPIADVQMGGSHLVVRTDGGALYTYGKGTPLCLPKAARKSWQLTEVTEDILGGRRVVDIACGPNSTALLLA